MANGWESYRLLVYTGLIALVIPLLPMIWIAIRSSKKKGFPRIRIRTSASTPVKVNFRYTNAVGACLIYISFCLLLIPIVAGSSGEGAGLVGVVITGSLATFLLLGVLYSASKGDLNWNRSQQELERDQ